MAQAQWMGWAPPPTQKPGKFDFLAPMLESYFKGKEQFNQRQDFRNIQAPGFDLGGLQSNAYQGAMGQQALQNRMPLSPIDQARMGLIQAQTLSEGQPTPQYSKPTVLGKDNPYKMPEGTTVQESPAGEMVFKTPPSKPGLRPVNIGERTGVFDPSSGSITPTEYPSSRVPSTNVTVTSGIEKSTKGAVEQKIESLDTMLANIDEIDRTTEDSFLSYGGQLGAAATGFGEKLLGKKLASSPYLAKQSAWKMLAMEQFLAKRKEITGVAANPTEQKDIAKAVPNPEGDSLTSFRSKQKQLRNMLQQHRNRLVLLRSQGIEDPTPEQLSKYPLKLRPADELSSAPKSPASPIQKPIGVMTDDELQQERRRLTGEQ